MSKQLVLAEKPSVGRDIAKVLGCTQGGNGFLEGKDYVVTWALGHLVTLADPENYNDKYKSWDMEDLPIIPNRFKLVVIKKTTKQYQTVKTQMLRKDISEIIIATDAGREGELVARWIIEKAGVKKPLKRLWISSVTDKAIKDGFKNLKDGKAYDSLYAAANARSEADWIVGINATRALTVRYNAELSCGRVQTPTLAMIGARMDEIRSFRPVPFYGLEFTAEGLKWVWKDQKSNSSRTFESSRIEALKKTLAGKEAVITKAQTKEKKTFAPPLYDLTELQRDANQIFGFSAKETLNIMQKLYETHKVLTYPRTDSRYLTSDMEQTIPDRLKAVAIGPYRGTANALIREKASAKTMIDDQRVGDHHAIIPTEQTAILQALSDKERKIYDLVVKRFLAVLSKPYVYEETALEAQVGGEIFTNKHTRTLSLGFKALYSEGDEGSQAGRGPILKQGQSTIPSNLKETKGQTTPPPYFTEGTLLSAMENPAAYLEQPNKELAQTLKATGGIGTVATRADIIEKLFEKFMIEKKEQAIHLTAKGRQLLELVPAELKSPKLTGEWEQKLKAIEGRSLDAGKFIGEMKVYAHDSIAAIKSSDATYKHENLTSSKCPECGDFMLSVTGKRGKMLVCQNRECKTRKVISQTTNARCPNCKKKLEMRGDGDKKMFSCVCGFREKLSTFEKRKKEQRNQGSKRDVQNYLKNQDKQEEPLNNAFADLLKNFKA